VRHRRRAPAVSSHEAGLAVNGRRPGQVAAIGHWQAIAAVWRRRGTDELIVWVCRLINATLENWVGDYGESFAFSLLEAEVKEHVAAILSVFLDEVCKLDSSFPDDVRPGTFSTVLVDKMPYLKLASAARPLVPDVIAGFFEYCRDQGRLGDGDDWARQIRIIGQSYIKRLKPDGGVRGVTHVKAGPKIQRNDPCPCGSGRKYKKCCGR